MNTREVILIIEKLSAMSSSLAGAARSGEAVTFKTEGLMYYAKTLLDINAKLMELIPDKKLSADPADDV